MKIMLITPYSCRPWPSAKGGGPQRTMLMRDALSHLGEVCVVAATPCTSISSRQVQQASGQGIRNDNLKEILYNPAREAGMFRILKMVLGGDLRRVAKNLAILSADFSVPDQEAFKELRTLVREFKPDLLVCRLLPWAVATGAVFVADIPVLLDFDDVDWLIHAAQEEQMAALGTARRLHGKLCRWIVERNARKCLRRFAHVWVASEEDHAIVGGRSCSVLPNVPILPVSEGRTTPEGKRDELGILFVGSLGRRPNREGLDRFLDHVWPHLHEAVPELRLRIVGPLPSDDEGSSEARWRQFPNVDVLGLIEDLGVEYERALFTIAPVYWGGGTKIKVLESLGRGKTCVLTPHALYGLGHYVTHNDSVLCVASDAEFAEACLKLVRSESLRQRLATRGEEVIRQHFSVARFDGGVADVVARFAGKYQGVEA